MIRIFNGSLAITLFLIPVIVLAAGEKTVSFSPYVDTKGNITLPSDFRWRWSHLGTWVVTSQAPTPGVEVGKTTPGSGLHEVYTQPESVRAFKKTGRWPDGTVLVKEICDLSWDDLSTGHVIYAGKTADWFVMVKDRSGRFKNNPIWGDGWGWALFEAVDPKKNVSANYKKDCMGCHEVAKDTDWVFIHGYPTLK